MAWKHAPVCKIKCWRVQTDFIFAFRGLISDFSAVCEHALTYRDHASVLDKTKKNIVQNCSMQNQTSKQKKSPNLELCVSNFFPNLSKLPRFVRECTKTTLAAGVFSLYPSLLPGERDSCLSSPRHRTESCLFLKAKRKGKEREENSWHRGQVNSCF